MKIAQVCPYDFSRPGGVKSHIINLSSQLSKLGHDVNIIAPNINAGLIKETNVFFFGDNRSLNIGGTKIDINLALGTDFNELRSFLSEKKFDIIHFHTIWNPLLPFQIRYLSLKHTKHVATFHDTPKSKWVGKTLMPIAARMIFPFLDQIISVSKSQSKFISRFSKKQISIIPNGIDLDQFHTNDELKRDEHTLLFLGRLEPRKGVMYALEVFRKLKATRPDLQLVIAGDGDERPQVEAYIAKHNLENVSLLGFVSEEKKVRLLQLATIYLATAVYGESFGIVLLEAMATGTPVVGFSNDGYKNVLTKEMLPYFPDPKDVKGLTSAVDALIKDSEGRRRLVQRGIKEVNQYDWNTVAKQVEERYNEAMRK